jgi:hypothetical protein
MAHSSLRSANHNLRITTPALWVPILAIGLPTGLSLWLYWLTAAPGLTWAHFGADGGDLIAAALVNGVPHPSGYPLYTLLLQGWLALGHFINPGVEPAYWGNRLSGLCVAGTVALTVATVSSLLRPRPMHWLWAALAGVCWAITPLAWSQALITEVYALHALLIAALGWALLTNRLSIVGLGVLMGLGAAHHLTSLLLWPAILYWRAQTLARPAWLWAALRLAGAILLTTSLFYARLGWVVTVPATPPPVAWGYPQEGSGFWWLVSGEAYRAYVFGMTPLEYSGRLAALARYLVEQFSPVGLLLVLAGLAVWDRQRPHLRNGALLWMLPISLYAAGYNTIDSHIYLLPVIWLASVMLGEGLASVSEWLNRRVSPIIENGWNAGVVGGVGLVVLIGLMTLTLWRFPQLDLRADREAEDFLSAATLTLQPNSLVISSADAETFALWYGEWGSGTLAEAVPDLILINYALYQFGWYRQLMHDLYPEVPGMGEAFETLIAANRALRPIYLAEYPAMPLPVFPSDQLTPEGIFWRLTMP